MAGESVFFCAAGWVAAGCVAAGCVAAGLVAAGWVAEGCVVAGWVAGACVVAGWVAGCVGCGAVPGVWVVGEGAALVFASEGTVGAAGWEVPCPAG